MSKPSTTTVSIFIAVAAVMIVAMLVVRRPTVPRSAAEVRPPVATPSASVAPTPFTQPIITNLPPRAHPPDPAVSTAKAKTFESFKLRPFEVATKNGANAWTKEDGMSPEVIRQLAHNEWEVERMTGENPTIKRRQLVYRNEPITTTIDRARASGQPVTSFVLPALDGQEYEVEVTQNNVQSEKMAGSLAGHLKYRPNSMASIGFVNGYESFNIISPDEGLYIVADSREPGEVMVKEIDPGKYALPPGNGNPPDFVPGK